MAEELRGGNGGRRPIPVRDAMGEPESLERGVEHHLGTERKVGDRVPGEAAMGSREPQEPREPLGGRRARGDQPGLLSRARDVIDRMRHRE